MAESEPKTKLPPLSEMPPEYRQRYRTLQVKVLEKFKGQWGPEKCEQITQEVIWDIIKHDRAQNKSQPKPEAQGTLFG